MTPRTFIYIAIAIGVLWNLGGRLMMLGGGFGGLPPGPVVGVEPDQYDLISPQKVSFKNYTMIKHARFDIEALVLSAKHYNFGRESGLAPVDLALGWKQMSDKDVLKQLKISQGRRFYFYFYKNPPPIPKRSIVESSANMHMIPADNDVKRKLKRVRKGDVVKISGYLVDLRADDGWRWNSSRTRSDSGGGACEVVFVEDIEVYDPA